MKSLRIGLIGLIIVPAALLGCQDLAELRALLLNRTDEAHKAVGIIVGLVDATGSRFITAGASAPGGAVAPNPDTVFEIGSITKVFTSLVLADMVERGEVKLDDPVVKFLPQAVRVPSRDGRQITLIDLSNHVSGLPRMPDNFKPTDMGDPYADYGPAQLYEFLYRYQLPRAVGATYEYSNLGVGLLGHALALKAGVGYEELVRRRVLEPLGMKDTAITLPESLKKRLATGTDPSLLPVKGWGFDALAGAGALRSTARDMLKFLTSAMGLRETPLRKAFDRMPLARRPTGTPDLAIAMGWHVWERYGKVIVWHNGGTGGFGSFAGFDPANKMGVVVLCNTAFGVDDLGVHALELHWPVARFRPPVEGKAVDMKKLIVEIAGDYDFSSEGGSMIVQFTEKDGKMFGAPVGETPEEIKHVEGKPLCFDVTVNGQHYELQFVRNEKGVIDKCVMSVMSMTIEGMKIIK